MPVSDSRSRRSGLEGNESVVQQLMGQAQQRQHEQKTRGRGKPGHAGQIGRDKSGYAKATYRIPINRQNLVREMAAAEEVGQHDIIEVAIVALYNAWRSGQLDLEALKVPARSLRVLWTLEVPDDFTISADE